MWRVLLEKSAERSLKKAPTNIQQKFEVWCTIIQTEGPSGVIKMIGFQDHALKGEWLGARASRLNLKWRVIYYIYREEVKILVMEVTPHDYRKKS
jgi:addiction module RelE/StbE family toxin